TSHQLPSYISAMSSRRVPLEKRQRTETSCDKCKVRKQKCQKPRGEETCTYCADHNIKCVTSQARKTRLYGSVEGLSMRLALLEGLVKGLLPEADLSSIPEMQALGQRLGIPLPLPEEGLPRKSDSDTKPEEESTARPDQQGQMQYIGRNSSFFFHLQLRALLQHRYTPQRFVMMGGSEQNSNSSRASDRMTDPERLLLSSTDPAALPVLVDCFFRGIHPDFPVIHEPSFRESFQTWLVSPSSMDHSWLCSLCCIFLLARRICPVYVSTDQEARWGSQVQQFLPRVLLTSSVSAIQALLLAALHLHHTSHRDACWSLTGTAVRIGFAIGLHRDSIRSIQTPIPKEFRKQLWWVLFAFEQMQVSSHDRPGAINEDYSVQSPQLSMTGMAGQHPQDYFVWFASLTRLFARACRLPRDIGDTALEGLLSPTARLLRDLARWDSSLPSHLSIRNMEEPPQSLQRAVLLLHANKSYVVTLVCRSALLFRAKVTSENAAKTLPVTTMSMSAQCVESGRSLCHVLLKLEKIRKFNAVSWWDCYYAFSSALVLVLDVFCDVMQKSRTSTSESQILLKQLAATMSRQIGNQMMPGSLRKWAEITIELNTIIEEFVSMGAPWQRPRQVPTQAMQANISAAGHMLAFCGFDELSTYGGSYPIIDEVRSPRYVVDASPGPSDQGAAPQQSIIHNMEDGHMWQALNWDDIGAMFWHDHPPIFS
ncbi:fungal-specific transcription factor domain-containing protein, partial [Delphinella strobiligena]